MFVVSLKRLTSYWIPNTTKEWVHSKPKIPSHEILLSLNAPILITLVLSLFMPKPDIFVKPSQFSMSMTTNRECLSPFRRRVVSSAY